MIRPNWPRPEHIDTLAAFVVIRGSVLSKVIKIFKALVNKYYILRSLAVIPHKTEEKSVNVVI